MAVIGTRSVKISFGGPAILEDASFSMDKGERICLVGRNGSGKSTLLRLLSGQIQPDAGEVVRAKGITMAWLDQEVPGQMHGSVREVATPDASARHDDEMPRLTATVDGLLDLMGVPPEKGFAALSGGLKRRVMLVRALAAQPDLLLLDEPTNHLDLATIEKVEGILKGWRGALLFITHDRMFLDRLATRILELDRGRLTDWPGNYQTYQLRKEAALESEATSNALFDKRLAQEEVWIRQGIKARRTRNEGRVRALQKMRAERQARRELEGRVRLRAEMAEKTGKLVVVAEEVGYQYDGIPYIQNFSTVIQRGDKIGIIGPNGCGKTTLLNLLLGHLTPHNGTIRPGTNLEVAYFDQLRAGLDEEKTVADNVANGREMITVAGQTRHVIGYLQDFLFPPARARSPVRILSGGERNRLLLAKLFLQPANILVMDEPTNDLDSDTLDLLEELLAQYNGTLLLVSHDRAFLNNVVTSCLVFEGQPGEIREYAGGYDDWLRQRPPPPLPAEIRPAVKKNPPKPAPGRKTGLSFKEKRELEQLPARIETLESEQQQLHAAMADPAYFRHPPEQRAADRTRLTTLEAELENAYLRWEHLEAQEGIR
ncbi:MAG: ATP-binding cassette domain-containing protein [Magnetococcales bacterium]|nr:ATP-binding cassette domain-containing protein [Magnetococcales bacterium]